MSKQTAILGGGNFWNLDAVFSEVEGVLAVEAGYAGGWLRDPDREQVCSGQTGHAEVVRVTFESGKVRYSQLLDIFFAIHDPTTVNRQGGDVGPQYRSVIFALSPRQRQVANATIAELEAQHAFNAPIVTTIENAATFWPAESHLQHYFAQHPSMSYCRFVVQPKLDKFHRRFAALSRS
ncbi:peptide-methionine (S)-S-oxide reductase MsrA [Nitrogeniibacter aestuarii]|uniref:peptide-methionine (S)-S-oxide reductase MsrA n=1 Tax=Nitrogeniibacter aestuarii TaxID=2815343 RepID=UPI001E659507|nr:peptide-methionine (S)-S-oxide reductase MsrA [Nitrogeniibacter aestuarii]